MLLLIVSWYFKRMCGLRCWDLLALWYPPSRTWKERCRRQWLRRCLIISVTPPPLSSYWQWLLLPLWMPPTEMRSARLTWLLSIMSDYFPFTLGLLSDVIARRYSRKGLPTLRTMPINLAPQQRRLLPWARPTKAQWRESRLLSSQQET